MAAKRPGGGGRGVGERAGKWFERTERCGVGKSLLKKMRVCGGRGGKAKWVGKNEKEGGRVWGCVLKGGKSEVGWI